MSLQTKIAQARECITGTMTPAAAVMCSFGKDSMVLLHLIRESLGAVPGRPNRLGCHSYPLPVIYHRHPWFPSKHEFADSVIRSWSLEVHDYPPGACGIKARVKDKSHAAGLELVARYPFGNSAMDLPINVEPPMPRRDFVCGLQWILQPKLGRLEPFPWRTVYIGHKSSDVDPYEGQVPLKSDRAQVGGVEIVFPLRDWTDADVWDYLEENGVAYDNRRYANRVEFSDKWLNPDYLHACTKCIDPRENSSEVFCPKLGEMVENVGNRVLRLEQRPDYIEGKAAA